MNMKKTCKFAVLALLPVACWAAPHVEETLVVSKGWNLVYVESTPDHAECEEFFADTPVIGAACYVSGAGSSTAQYDADGKEIVQAPISYLQWIRGEESTSTLQAILGGNVFLLYATNAATIPFQGVPCAPKTTWHKVSASETNELLNVAGVSSAATNVSINAYFGEGPFGMSQTGRAIYAITGEDTEEGPDLVNAERGSFGRAATIRGGQAYALTATRAGDWPGVIEVQGSGVAFGSGDNYASVKVKNRGTQAREFRFTLERSASGEEPPPVSRRLPRVDAISALEWTNVAVGASWTVALEPDEVAEPIFGLDRSRLAAGTEYGAILVVEDLGGSQMRVRLPVSAAGAPEGAVAYPTGLWVGEIALSKVSGMDDATPTPVEAGGTLKMNVMVHVDAAGTCRLLQRVAAGMDTNGAPRLFRELESVPADIEEPRRISTVMMSVDTPVVEASAGSAFGDSLAFAWTVGEKARDNPFRHAWHPDHDGKKADYSGDAPSGDDFSNYADPIKPELWSIPNRLVLSWHENGDPGLPVQFPYNADETTSGVVTWEVEGLIAKGPIKSVGTFTLQRVFCAKELEE